MDAKSHWEAVYQTKQPNQVSWFQRKATLSASLIQRVAPDPATTIRRRRRRLTARR
jgi:hypothetical protein